MGLIRETTVDRVETLHEVVDKELESSRRYEPGERELLVEVRRVLEWCRTGGEEEVSPALGSIMKKARRRLTRKGG